VSRVVGFAAPVERSAKPYPVSPAGISGCNCRGGPLGHWHRAPVLASAVALADSAPRQVRVVCSRTDALYGQHVTLGSRTDRGPGASPAFRMPRSGGSGSTATDRLLPRPAGSRSVVVVRVRCWGRGSVGRGGLSERTARHWRTWWARHGPTAHDRVPDAYSQLTRTYRPPGPTRFQTRSRWPWRR
jgi:hypothetical protein